MSLNRNQGFPTFVNRHLAPGVTGGFASMNPRAVVLAGPGAMRADDTDEVIVGYFAWGVPATGIAHGAEQSNSFLGFVANEGQTVITDFLGVARLAVQAGFPVTLYSHGDFWAFVNATSGAAVSIGDSIFADATTGEPVTDDASGANPDTGFVAATAAPANPSSTAASLAATGVLTVGATLTGTIEIGDGNSVHVTGANVPDNVFITAQLTGSAGSTGTYATTSRGVVVTTEAMSFVTGRLVKITRTF
jgi:hypothetical protein